MKKFFFLLASGMLLGSSVAQAQYKAEANTWSVEMNYSPGGADNGRFDLQKYGARVRYHMSNNLALRFNVGIGTSSDISTTYFKDSNDKEYESDAKVFVNKFSFMPGLEYHFDKFERVSPFIGGELGFIAGNTGNKTDNTRNDNYTVEKTPFFGFGINFVTGFDVYVCKGLYLGAELGLGYEYNSTGRKNTEVSNGNTVENEDGNSALSSHDFGFNVNPSIRIGWNF